MKKKQIYCRSCLKKASNHWVTLLIFVCIPLTANAYSQSGKITINKQQVSIKEIFEIIRTNTDYSVLYKTVDFDDGRLIDINVKDVFVTEVVRLAIKGQRVNVIVKDKQIILKRISQTSSTNNQQSKSVVKGVIVDVEGNPIPGIAITIKGTSLGTVTDVNGKYSIEIPEMAGILVFSSLGMETQEIPINGRFVINTIMKESMEGLDEVTVVAFGKQKKESVIGAIATVSPKELSMPSSNFTAALAGRLSGIISYQRNGEPGQDNADFFVRGVTSFGYNNKPLILIDNIELTSSDLARLQPDDIESFSVMKDATATALYGARGANGVIYVTTKEGIKGKPVFSLRYENSISTPTQQIEFGDPVTYMKLHNEAYLTREPLAQLPYSNDKIDRTIPGSGSVIYPSTDWRDELIRDYSTSNRVNISVKGGGETARYYVAGSFSKDNGILKVDKNNDFNSNIDFKAYTLRSNINVDVTKTTEMIVRLSGAFEDYNGPIGKGSEIYRKIMASNPVLFPAKYPIDQEHQFVNHTLFGNVGDGNYLNPYAEMVKGYQESGNSKLGAQLELKQDLGFITEGLKARLLFNATRGASHSLSRQLNPFFYKLKDYDYYKNEYSIELINPDKGTEHLTYKPGNKNVTSFTYLESAINYYRDFNKQSVSGLLVGQLRHEARPNAEELQESLPYRNIGLSGRFTYSFDSRYFTELNFGWNGSERFSKKNRFGFFPSAGLGWMVSNEPFFVSCKKWVSNLKFRVSYGLVGNDRLSKERFLYLSNVNMSNGGSGAVFGKDWGYSQNGISVDRYADPNISWEVAYKTNFAMELGIRNNLNLIAEYFTEDRTKILQARKTIPGSMGLWVEPKANIGRAKSHGVDLDMNYNVSFNTLKRRSWLTLRGTFTYSTSEYVDYEDYEYPDEWWKNREGYPIDQKWGYIAEGLFVDEAEVNNSPQQFGEYMAGDIKYRDVNNDGVIDSRDMVPIGFPTKPEINYGFGGSFGYGAIDFSLFFTGLARESFWINYNSVSPFFDTVSDFESNNALAQFIVDSHWSEDNRDTYALWPRLSPNSVSNNSQTSTWFMRDGSFLRLKQLELGYTIPDRLTEKVSIKTLRFYLSGTNLLTFSKFKLWDPEMAGDGLDYPIQRVFNFGVNLSF